jgi:hypothetical protein
MTTSLLKVEKPPTMEVGESGNPTLKPIVPYLSEEFK